MTKYYIREGKVFSDKKTPISLVNEIGGLNFSSDNIFDKSKFIVEKLEEAITKARKLEVSGHIENSSQIIKKIENLKNTTAKNLKKVSSDDIEFVEKTSQLEIINQIISFFEKHPLKNIEEEIIIHIGRAKKYEETKLKELEELILNQGKKVDLKKKERDKYIESEVKKLKNDFNEKTKLKEGFEKKIKELEKKVEDIESKEESKSVKKIFREIKEINNLIKEFELDIEVRKARIKTLETQYKLGERKRVNWTIAILTLGLSYWTKFSDIKYLVKKNLNSINKLEEKILENKKKILKFENKLLDFKEEKKELAKQIQEHIKKSDEHKNELSKVEKELEKIQEEIEKKNKRVEEIENEIKLENEKLEALVIDKKTHEKYSSKSIQKYLEKIDKLHKNEEKMLKELRDKIDNQKTNVKGDWVAEI